MKYFLCRPNGTDLPNLVAKGAVPPRILWYHSYPVALQFAQIEALFVSQPPLAWSTR